jgi:putative NADPH-quinone reductase
MKVLLVSAHVRPNSLTKAVADAFVEAAGLNGHKFEIANLVDEGFDPVLHKIDEPDWNDPNKIYSEAVREEMARIERNEATVMVFPVWWWSTPAILKGWIDRVWNNGWAYGARTYPHKRVWMLAIAGGDEASYAKRGYDVAIRTQLETGILEYCGIEDRRLTILYGSLEGPPYPKQIIEQARALGSKF